MATKPHDLKKTEIIVNVLDKELGRKICHSYTYFTPTFNTYIRSRKRDMQKIVLSDL